MSLTAGKEWLADVYNFGFLALDVNSRSNVLSLCSPSGHVLIFTKVGPGLQLPLEVRDILNKITDVKKVALFKDQVDTLFDNNSMTRIPIVNLHPTAKKQVEEISFGTQNFFKQQLGKDFLTRGEFDLDVNGEHIKQAAHLCRTVSYAVWFIAARQATRAGHGPQGNLSSFLRYTLYSEDADMYANLIADPYYVPFEESKLTPLHQLTLEQETTRLKYPLRASYKNYRFKPKTPFGMDHSRPKCCPICGLYTDPKYKHRCTVQPDCRYPYCRPEAPPHSLITCRIIRAWCNICQRRGHQDELHDRVDRKFPTSYFWDVFLHFSRLNLDTAFVYKGDKCQNPYFHQMGLYGLPPSKLPKVAPESGVGKDLPDDKRFKRPDPASPSRVTAATSITRRPTMPVKIDLRTLNKTKPGRVEKAKPITYSSLTEALNLVKRLSSGEQAGSSGLQNKLADPVITKLLDFVKDIKQGGLTPTAVETSSTAKTPEVKLSRKQRRLVKQQAKDAEAAKLSAEMELEDQDQVSDLPPPLATSKQRSRTTSEIERERLLAPTDEELAAGQLYVNTTPVNTSQDVSDLMDDSEAPVHPSQVESLADTVQQVALQDQGIEQRQSDNP